MNGLVGRPLFVGSRLRARQYLPAGRRAKAFSRLGGTELASVFRIQPEPLLTACCGKANQALR
jgi:hypothetical protein